MALDIGMQVLMPIKHLLIRNDKEMYFKTILGIHMFLLLIEGYSKSLTNEMDMCVCV